MNCPRCVRTIRDPKGPYRGAPDQELPVTLASESHGSGATVFRCERCGGAFVSHEDLLRIESYGRERPGASAAEVARRAFAPATTTIACASCGEETNRRQWGIATLVYVDVCVECRGVWLDLGELEAIERKPT